MHATVIHHSELCKQNHSVITRERKQWKQAFPNFCPECDGWGNNIGNQQPINTIYSNRDTMLCNCCTAINRCSRCNREGLVNSQGPCTFCGWDYNDGVPAKPECMCEED